MNRVDESNVGKGNDENLRRYQLKNDKRKLFRKLIVPISVGLLLLILAVILLVFCFVVRSIKVEGATGYTAEELIQKSGIDVGDNILSLSENAVEERLKKAFPYIKSVTVEKNYPSGVVLHVKEEYTTFYYEAEGEYFLFNHNLRLMDKFDSAEALADVRQSIYVEMPLPKSSIVPQYIQLREEHAYVSEVIHTLSESSLVELVTYLDVRDKYVLRMKCGKDVTVELGDYTNLENKLSALSRLLGENGSKMSGNVDLTCYPQCFYRLNEEYD